MIKYDRKRPIILTFGPYGVIKLIFIRDVLVFYQKIFNTTPVSNIGRVKFIVLTGYRLSSISRVKYLNSVHQLDTYQILAE